MSHDAYSALKVFHHQDRLNELKARRLPSPAQVQLIISDLCNQDCGFCAYRMSGYTTNQLFAVGELATFGHNNPKRMIEYNKIVEILDDCLYMGVQAIQLTGGGEPTVHPQFTQVLEGIVNRGLDLALVTNGMKLRPKDIELLGRAKWVRVSVDAGTASTYAATRNTNVMNYARVWDNVAALAAQKKVSGNRELQIGIGYVVTKENWTEIEAGVQDAAKSGADNIRLSAVFQTEGDAYFKDFYKEAAHTCAEMKRRYETPTFAVYNMFGDRVEDLHQASPDYSFCGYQHFNTYIGGDLNVYRCCTTAYNYQGLIGSLKDTSFREMWESPATYDKMFHFDARSCERCMFNGKNRTILYALSDKPMHVNYI